MQKIPVKLAAEGMKLAKPITRDNGMVVIAEGAELTESLISRLENMNVERIFVEGNPVNMDGAGNSSWDKKSKRVGYLFRRYKNDKWMCRVGGFFKGYFDLKAAAQKALEEEMKRAEEAKKASEQEVVLEEDNSNTSSDQD